ncbi:biotin transporter BioY [bacterium]|nr:MAG: biotin transporter BioY [bacterium]
MQSRTKTMVLMALTIALTSAGAYLRIPIGPVPITLQTFFVLISGAVLGPGPGAMAMAAYIILGLVGLPIFSSGGGPQYIISPTFGFLLSFPVASAVVGYGLKWAEIKESRIRITAVLLLGTGTIYLIGVPYLAGYLRWIQQKEVGLGSVVMMGMVPFLPGDLAKVVIGSWVISPLRRIFYQTR